MPRTFVILSIGLLIAGCQSVQERHDTHESNVSGVDGLTLEHALVLTGGNEFTNTDTEYTWIRQHEPSGRVTSQSLLHDNSKFYDRLDV